MNQTDLKIIDFEKKGNVVRFYLGDRDCDDYWGDDWNDRPYEHNAGLVYDRFVVNTLDLAFPFDSLVLEPCDGTINSEHSKEDMKKKLVPCLLIVPPAIAEDIGWRFDDFQYWVGNAQALRIYFGDNIETVKESLIPVNLIFI